MIKALYPKSILLLNYSKSNILAKSLSICKSPILAKAINKDDGFNNPTFSENLPVLVKPSIITRLKETLGMQGEYRYSQQKMDIAAVRLYLCIQRQIDYNKFFQICQSRDVFVSFCLVTYLHVWIISVRLAQEGRSGDFVKKRLMVAMWKDIEKRIKELGAMDKKLKKYSYDEIGSMFNATLFGYDEGILSNDCILSAAIWRHLLEMRDLNDFSILTKLCEYVRKNVKHFDDINEKDLLLNGVVTFVDFDKQSVNHLKEREKHLEYIFSFK